MILGESLKLSNYYGACCVPMLQLWLTNVIIYSLLLFLSSEPPLKSLNMVTEGSVVQQLVQ